MNQAKLVWITPEAEKHIAYCARVSNPANQDNPEIARLLKYCIKHGHWSIFEMASMCVEIKTTRAISPQILRHRSFSFQEFSQRYAVAEKPDVPEQRLAGLYNRQSSLALPHFDELNTEQQTALRLAEQSIEASHEAYKALVVSGIATETARAILPLATPTTMYMTGTIRSWIHYVQLRTKMDTQQEHRDIAVAINNILWDNIPTTMQAMEEHWV